MFLRIFQLTLVLCLAASLSSCTPEGPSKECIDNSDCGKDERCFRNQCRENKAINQKPVARIKAPEKAKVKEEVLLDGSDSTDPEGSSLKYSWVLESAPEGSKAKIADDAASKARLTPDVPGSYVIELVVTDDQKQDSAPVRWSLEVEASGPNSPPIANAGSDRFGGVGQKLTLDGSGSSDPDGDALLYAWSLKSKPDGSQAKLSDPAASKPEVTFDKKGKYIFSLVVNDGQVDSDPDSATIEILDDFDLEPSSAKLEPSEAPIDTQVDVTLTGKGFSSRASVLFDGVALADDKVQIKGSTEIVLKLDLSGRTAKEYPVVVRNPNGKESPPLSFKVLDLPAPTLTALDPTSGLAGGTYTLTVTGTGFVKASKVLFNLLPLPTTHKSDTQLEAQLDLSQTKAGDYKIKVQNPGGKASSELAFKVNSDGGFAPVLRVLNPSQATVGTTIPFSVHGSSFAAGAEIIFDGKAIPSIRQSRDTIEADPSLDLSKLAVGTYSVWVRNPNGKESNKETFEVIEKDPAPKLDRILPPTLYLNDNNKIDVYGSYFDPKVKLFIGSKEFSGAALSQVSTSYFTLAVDTRQGTWSAGNVQAYLENPNGKKSNTFTLTLAQKPSVPTPKITRLSPSSEETGKTISSFRIYASDLCSSGTTSCSPAPRVLFTDSSGVDLQAKNKILTSISTRISSSSYLQGRLNLSNVPPGGYKIQLEHPSTKALSNAFTFTVRSPQSAQPLSLNYVYPYYARSGSVVKCDLNGGPFTSSSFVRIGTDTIPLLSGTSKTRRSFNFDVKTKYAKSGNYNIQVCNSATVCSNVFAYPVMSATGTDPFITAVRGQTYPLYTNTTVDLSIFGYRWVDATTAQFFLDGKELNNTHFQFSSRTCKKASSATSSSNCLFKQFSTKGLAVGKHTMQVKWSNASSITYDFYVTKP